MFETSGYNIRIYQLRKQKEAERGWKIIISGIITVFIYQIVYKSIAADAFLYKKVNMKF